MRTKYGSGNLIELTVWYLQDETETLTVLFVKAKNKI